ncbi:uncharacterized protein LOC122064597 [Macadamia integrifolia]|uniref:uncharacterized protein LOC122064597 n=1 Tax=Macadamia integrifolia TaxID=60698 RepID=UPI001C4F4EE3|nr:uncharacterized protein LOC122064597 [Macadamia integrifolia]
MLGIFISSLVVIEKRTGLVEVFSERVQKLWNEWELRVLVLLSLLLQVLLIFFGSSRKYTVSIWVRIILWLSYLSAETVATTALGALSHGQGHPGSNELTALWAPFLLLHLGGPDTITAYSLEDNELWMRQFLVLVQQVCIATYVLIRSWYYSRVSILTVFMFIPGIVKYGERIWVLRLASKEQFRSSLLDPPDPSPNYAKFMNDYASKYAEESGVRVTGRMIAEVMMQMEEGSHTQSEEDDDSRAQSEEAQQKPNRLSNLSDAEVLPMAYKFFETFKRLFADLILSEHDWKESREFFQKNSSRTAFKVIEMELGFMYDLLYSKAALAYSYKGSILRCISFSSVIFLLVAFLTGDKVHHYLDVDIVITYLLFIGAFIIEVYAIFILISSDWAFLWLRKNNVINSIPLVSNALKKRLSSRKRWSNFVAQYNFISLCVKDKPSKILPKILRLLCVDKLLENYCHTFYTEVLSRSKEFIFKELHIKSRKVAKIGDIKNLRTSISDSVLQKIDHLRDKLKWSLNDVDFNKNIILWHIATDLCYECHDDISPITVGKRETSKLLSDYMFYLLMNRPFMLPEGVGQNWFQDTCEDAKQFFKQTKSGFNKIEACEKLLEWGTSRTIDPKGEKSKSVLFDACRLGNILRSLKEEESDKWEIMSLVWLEMLTYAASQCRRPNHAQQLRRGGEFITHIWLLMAHLGITELFQIPEERGSVIY